jgi:hypothetical protein
MSHRAGLATACVLALLAAGSVPARAVGAASCGGSARGLKTVSLSKAGFRIGVPQSWQAMSGQSYGRVLDDAAAKDPTIAAYAAALKDPRSPLKLFARACEPGRAYPSTLSIIALDVKRSQNWSFADFERGTLRALREHAVPGHAPKVETFRVGIGRSVRIRALERPPGAPAPLSMTTYVVQSRRTAYLISYATVPEIARRYVELFDASVRSLREL